MMPCVTFALWFAMVVSAIIGSGSCAHSAGFDIDLHRSPCQIRLTGKIEPGDFIQFKSKMPKDYDPPLAGPTMCLASPGGDFLEALKIAEFVSEGILTKLEPGATCLSACGWIFMAGTNNSPGGTRSWTREMDASATLAFHAPYIDPSSLKTGSAAVGELSLASVIQAYNQAVAEISEGLLKLAQKYDSPVTSPLIPPDLLVEALSRVNDQKLMVDTVGSAIKWRIDVTGHAGVVPRRKEDIIQACWLASIQPRARHWSARCLATAQRSPAVKA